MASNLVLGETVFQNIFQMISSCLAFGHLIRLKEKKTEVFNTILLHKILMNVSAILGNSLSNTLVIPEAWLGRRSTQPPASASSLQDALYPARSKAIKRVCKCSSRIHLECYFVKRLLGIHSIFHFGAAFSFVMTFYSKESLCSLIF